MGQRAMWGWCPETEEWVKLRVDADGSFHVVGYIDKLDDIGDVDVAAPTDLYVVYWNDTNSKWEARAFSDWVTAAHKDRHDPEDGADPLDTALPLKVAAANAEGTSHSLARADHVHEREHAKYTDAAAKAAAVQAGAITNAVTKAPTHDAVFDVKATADAALPAVDKYTDLEAKAQAEAAKLDDHAAPDDNTDLDASAAKHGLMPKLDKVKLDAIAALSTPATKELYFPVGATKYTGALGDQGNRPAIKLDGATEYCTIGIWVPADFTALTHAYVLVAASNNMTIDWTVATNFGAIGEVSGTHTDSVTANGVALTEAILYGLDITAAFTNLLAGDSAGVRFTLDAINTGDLRVIGIIFKYS